MSIYIKFFCRNCNVRLFEAHRDYLSLCGDCREVPVEDLEIPLEIKMYKLGYDYNSIADKENAHQYQ